MLDPLRALAAISILLVHTTIFSRAFDDPGYGRLLIHLDIGVAFFFVLSAFLLYRPFVEARVEGTPRRSFSEYGVRRFVRIAPAYWAALTVGAVIPGLAGAFSGNWWVYYGLLQNLPIYTPSGECAVNSFRCAIPTAWSLAIEVMFYALLPLFVLAMGWLGRRWRGWWMTLELAALAILTIVSIAIQATPPVGELHQWLFFSPLGRGWWFGLGLALAAVSVQLARRESEPAVIAWIRRRPGQVIAVAVALYAIACLAVLEPGPSLAFPGDDQLEYVFEYLLFGAIAALVVLPAVFGKDAGGLTRRVLAHPTLTWLGLVSYGIFLWQFPVLILLFDAGIEGFIPLTAAAFALTVACAALSYYLLERPLMRRVRRRGGRAPRPPQAGAEGLAVPVVAPKP